MNIDIISKIIISIETKYDLLNLNINNVYLWQSARNTIYTTILDQVLPNNSIKKRNNIFSFIKQILRRIVVNSIFYNTFFNLRKKDILIFESGRKYKNDDEYIDIYTKYIIEEQFIKNYNYQIFETSHLADNLGNRSFNKLHLDFIYLTGKFISLFYKSEITDEKSISIINKVKNDLETELGIKIDLFGILKKELRRFKGLYPLFYILIKIKNVSKIFLINAGDKSALVKAAKDNHAIVIELQHGLIVKEGLINNFPHVIENSLEYYPNYFYKWKDLDMCTSKLPISKEYIVEIENKHLLIQKNKYNYKDKKKQLLVISQPYCSSEISSFIINNIDKLKGLRIIYKLHPAEEKSTIITNLLISHNIVIINNEIPIYKLLAESEYVIGINSTAIFEATYFNCKVYLLNLPGIEISKILLLKNKAKLINIDDLIDLE